MLQVTQTRDGYALVLGLENGRLVEELVRQSDLYVIAVDADTQKVTDLRRRLHLSGVYGTRASVHVGDPVSYPFPPYLASLIVSESLHADGASVDRNTIADLTRLLRPYGGSGCLAVTAAQRSALETSLAVSPLDGISVELTGKWTIFTREGALAESADWSHPSADSGNTNASADQFVKAPLGLLWFDGALRWHRKPGSAEVRVAGGRIFIKGDKLHAIDVYTGRVLWNVALPFKHHPTDQLIALPDAVYVTSGQICIMVEPATGKTRGRFELPATAAGAWANVRISGDYLVGQNSNQLICADRHNGQLIWQYACSRAALSIAIGGDRVFCAELLNQRRGEAESESTKTRSFDLKTGAIQWEMVSGSPLRYSGPQDLLVTSGGVYRGRDGMLVTETSGFDEMHGNQKCDHLSIAGNRLLWGTVTSYAAYDLLSGRPLDDSMAWIRRGCTDLRASSNLITTRYRGNCAYIDLDSREITPLWNVRPACNNNLYPANGVLNIPCLTGGCECNYTPASQAYVPERLLITE
jgi:outer membrane protein assembly factor BamB